MAENKQNLVDVSRLYTLRTYAEKFGMSYNTVYGRFMSSLNGRAREPFKHVVIAGVDFIEVTEDQEKELLKKSKGGK